MDLKNAKFIFTNDRSISLTQFSYIFLETGTSDITHICSDQLQKCINSSLNSLSFIEKLAIIFLELKL